MLHMCASECAAAAVCAAALLLLVLLRCCAGHWLAARSWADVALFALVVVASCRRVARGRACRWPRGVDYAGRVALVVGASSGVGYGVAEELALHGWTVLLAGRDVRRLLRARQRIDDTLAAAVRRHERRQSSLVLSMRWLRKQLQWWLSHMCNNNDDSSNAAAASAATLSSSSSCNAAAGRVKVVATVDLAVEASVRAFATAMLRDEGYYPVTLLVHAAGVLHRHARYCRASSPRWAHVETMFATNALGPLLLTQLLLPLLERSAERVGAPSRVVHVASSCHTFLGVGAMARTDPMDLLLGLEVVAQQRSRVHAPLRRRRLSATAGSNGNSSNGSSSNGGDGEGGGDEDAAAALPAHCLPDDFTWRSFVGYYGLSKLCVVWNTALLARQLDMAAVASSSTTRAMTPRRVFVACCHPGVLVTHLYRELLPEWLLDNVLYWPSLLIGCTWREAAQSVLRAAIEVDALTTPQGGYYLCSGEYGAQRRAWCCLSAHARDARTLTRYARWALHKIDRDDLYTQLYS